MPALLRVPSVRQRLVLLSVLAVFGLGANSAAAIDTQALIAEVQRGLAAGEPGKIGVICANADVSAESALTAEQREVVVTEFVEACGGAVAALSSCPAWTSFFDAYQNTLASLGMSDGLIAADVAKWNGTVAALTEPAGGPGGTTNTASNFQGAAYATGNDIYPGYVTPRQTAAGSGVTEPDGSPTQLQ